MFLTTLNIKNNPDMPRRFVTADARYAKQLGRPRPWRVVLHQEIGEPEDHADVRATYGPAWQHVGVSTPNPLALTRTWRVLEAGVEHLHGGLQKVSPSRMVTWAVVQPRRPHRAVAPIVVTNAHYVSGAFSHPGQRGEEWRDDHWNAGHVIHGVLVRQFNAEGLTVVGGGDLNRRGDIPDLSPTCWWVAAAGYDHLYVSEAKGGTRVRVRRTATHRAGLHTDHPAVSAVLDLLP